VEKFEAHFGLIGGKHGRNQIYMFAVPTLIYWCENWILLT